jgi:hypothetical protein
MSYVVIDFERWLASKFFPKRDFIASTALGSVFWRAGMHKAA